MQDFFERIVFRSPSGGSEYDPQTYTMHLHRPMTDRPFEPVFLHELTHWFQHICYTFGGFQSALRHARDESAKDIFSQYARMKDECQRNQIRFSLPEGEAFFNPTFDQEGIEKGILRLQFAWRDALICENLFLRMSSFYEECGKEISTAHEILQPELLIPRTLMRLNNWAISSLCYKTTETKGYLGFTIDDHPKLTNFGQAKHANIELDTKGIIEGMAVAHEMYFLHSNQMESYDAPSYAKARLKKLGETKATAHYLDAIKIFLDIMGFFSVDSLRHDEVARMALMFLQIAEMSLNPPLPPFGTINKLELDWNKIYPPLRFIELCHIAKRAIGTSGYILDHTDIPWVIAWSIAVKSLYLAHGGVFSYLSKDEDGYLPAKKVTPFLSRIAEEDADMREILRRKGVNTIGMAEKLPEVLAQCTGLELYAMLRHGHILFMNWLGVPRPFLIPFQPNSHWNDRLYPPLMVFDNDRVTTAWTGDFAEYLIDINTIHYPLLDIMLRQKPRSYLENYKIINEVRRKRLWNHLQESFSYIF
jgi:hypothetical protein